MLVHLKDKVRSRRLTNKLLCDIKFQQVVSQVSKSRRELFKPLDEVARDVADIHTHELIRHKEILPTRNQLECFKPNIEFILAEIIVELEKRL